MPLAGIILHMRRVLSLFIMLLLALRGLAGDAMAIESPAAHDPVHAIAAATTAVATHMSHDMHDMHDTHDKSSDEHAHHQPAAHATTDLSQCGSANASDCNAHEHEHSHCTTCGLCHTAMGQADHLVLAGPGPAPSQPSLEADRFISVAAASLIKPPISGV